MERMKNGKSSLEKCECGCRKISECEWRLQPQPQKLFASYWPFSHHHHHHPQAFDNQNCRLITDTILHVTTSISTITISATTERAKGIPRPQHHSTLPPIHQGYGLLPHLLRRRRPRDSPPVSADQSCPHVSDMPQ